MKNFTNKTILITGAASGMGRALTLDFATQNAFIIATDKDEKGLAETLALSNTGNIQSFILDVSNKAAIGDFYQALLSKNISIDVLINNAGMALAPVPFDSVPLVDYEKIVAVNQWGVVNMCLTFIPMLKEKPEAAIVNLSSVFGLFGMPNNTPYAMTKYAVRGFTESIRQELSNTSVAVSCVHPGGIKTNIVRNSIFYDDNKNHVVTQFDKIAITSPEKAAQTIINGIRKKKKRILIGPDASLVYLMSRLWPAALDWGARRRVKEFS
jgi:short-subunit dehydrogenase